MSDKRTFLLGLLLASLAGCVTAQRPTSLTVVGSSTHAPYPAKPEYLGTRALPDPESLVRDNGVAAIHVSRPVVDTSGDDTDPGVAESAEPAEPMEAVEPDERAAAPEPEP